jgi:hypothetical protein
VRLLEPLLTEARRTGRIQAHLEDAEERISRANAVIETLAKEKLELEEALRKATQGAK